MIRVIRISEMENRRNAGTGIRVKNAKAPKRRLRLSGRQIAVVGLLFLLFMGSGIGYVWSNFEGTQIGYDVSRLKDEEVRLIELNEQLRIELATFKSPQYLEGAARALGLRAVAPEQIVDLR